MEATSTFLETLAAVRQHSATKLAVVKPVVTGPLPPRPPLSDEDKAMISQAAKLGAEWRDRANRENW